jgi:hypothetical protein
MAMHQQSPAGLQGIGALHCEQGVLIGAEAGSMMVRAD